MTFKCPNTCTKSFPQYVRIYNNDCPKLQKTLHHLTTIKNHNTDNTCTMIMYINSNEHRKIDATDSHTKKTKWNVNFAGA